MGEIADSMIDGEVCFLCGTYLCPGEIVFVRSSERKVKMPANGDWYGCPVLCQECHEDK